MAADPADAAACPRRAAFDALLRDRMRTPFQWGVHDCCTFAADAVLALTGQDPAADVRGTYGDEAGATAVLEAAGGLQAAGARAGEAIAPRAAAVGDVGLVQYAGREQLAVCAGSVWLVPATRGLAALPFTAAAAAWRVGRG